MKIHLHLLLAALTLLASTSARATYYDFTGTIRLISTSAPDLWGEWDYLLVEGLTSAGQCRLDAGYVLVRLTHSKAYATAIMAQASGKQVTVSIDDTRTDEQGYCILRWIKVLN